jgi:endonuclease/exonuclease/phosphatase family metal-dependent hydrolase
MRRRLVSAPVRGAIAAGVQRRSAGKSLCVVLMAHVARAAREKEKGMAALLQASLRRCVVQGAAAFARLYFCVTRVCCY